ncbi:hypothetical protein HJC23_008717 [Cyclotella cryptica]|uniref:FAD-binding domain-containing protein n=1 Tax=Cyclotella cryptica TaxID=29204 RepID=A0ABD3QPD3_9STRA
MNIPTRSAIFLSLLFHRTVLSLQPPAPRAIVVGAGPVGIAASLVLASRHGYDVTLLESSPETSIQTKYDPTKAFLYNVNARGQTLTKMFPNLHDKLVKRSVESKGFADATITVVPADPNLPIPKSSKLEKSFEMRNNENNEAGNAMPKSEKAVGVGYWIPRHEMVGLMVECIDEHNEKGEGGKISFYTGKECTSVSPRDVGGVFVEVYQADLVVGADGMNSKVRECLSHPRSAVGGWSLDCPKPNYFKLKKWRSPASFLRIKVLQLPPQFEIPDAEGNPPLITNSENIYAIRSIYKGPRNYLSLGLLPMKNNTAVRATNIVTRPDHEVWKLKDGIAIQTWFEKAFPRMNFNGMISNEEWDRFARAEGTRFPHCQYSRGMAVWDENGDSGVALVGDAIHAFPPDIGQGVNAGLMDVVCLDRALSGLDTVTGKEAKSAKENDKPSLGKNLARYQKQHSPEIASLIRLARFGAPYQYRQPHRADRILRTLWTLNVAMRLILNKITFNLVPPTCIILSQRPELTFRQVMRKADLTTLFLKVVVFGLIGLRFRPRFGILSMLKP